MGRLEVVAGAVAPGTKHQRTSILPIKMRVCLPPLSGLLYVPVDTTLSGNVFQFWFLK